MCVSNRRLTATRPREDYNRSDNHIAIPLSEDHSHNEFRSESTQRTERSGQSRSHYHRPTASRPSEIQNRQRSRCHDNQHNNCRDSELYQCRLCMRYYALLLNGPSKGHTQQPLINKSLSKLSNPSPTFSVLALRDHLLPKANSCGMSNLGPNLFFIYI
ncbi:hypothetical protein CVS40_8592 [Lucilia cuprina]|nr:hypothetical protein CVS40_8592 [Lucilia cuprina]